MKKITILFFCIIVFANTKGQIGVFTANPRTLLHLDTNKDNDLGGLYIDDIVITNEGNIGIGVESLAPATKLDVKGTFKYVDGNQSDKFILMSDANGNAYWGKEPFPFYVVGKKPEFKDISNQYKFIGPYITLTPGSWMISCVFTYSMYTALGLITNIYWDLSTSDTTLVSIGQVISNPSEGVSTIAYGFSTVYAVYLVTPTQKTTYYLWAKATNLPDGTLIKYSGEGQIWATAIADE